MTGQFTVVGGRGFLGNAIVEYLRAQGARVSTRRSDEPAAKDRGDVIYVSGIAWDADKRPLEAYDVHVERPRRALASFSADSFTYVSSTRVYEGAASTREDVRLEVDLSEKNATYKHSKIAGESLCLGIDDARVRVVRLSNLFGAHFRSGLIFSDVLRQAVRTGFVSVRTSRESSKDYVSGHDCAVLIPQIARKGRHRIYNIARGENTTNAVLLDALAAASGARIEIAPGSPTAMTPPISVARLGSEFKVPQERVEEAVPMLVKAFDDAERVLERSAVS